MKSTTVRILIAVAIASTLGISAGRAQTSSASTTVTTAELQRIQDNIAEISRDLPQVRTRDASLANQLQTELNDANDEAAYLKVKLRRQETVSRSDYLELLDKVDRIRAQARGESRTASPTRSASSGGVEIPSGTEFDARLQTALNSGTAQVEDRFEATTLVDLKQGDRVIVPSGSTLRGIVSSVDKAGRIERKGSLTVAFDRITINGRDYPIRATVTDALESEGYKGDVGKIGAGAGVGAIIGGIIGGAKGALAGILIGGGGTIAATEGKDVELPPGTVLRVRLDSGLSL
ncbi:MAG TPA: hypothetical protein VJP86_03090 [Vicinamibacterales bacterium]|nr:hypothetical protein [Vicinamibacterales bacterium]